MKLLFIQVVQATKVRSKQKQLDKLMKQVSNTRTRGVYILR